MQAVHEPDGRHPDPEMRVIGEQRPAACRLRRPDDPVVRPDAVVGGEPRPGVEAGQAEDPLAERRDVAPGARLAVRDGIRGEAPSAVSGSSRVLAPAGGDAVMTGMSAR